MWGRKRDIRTKLLRSLLRHWFSSLPCKNIWRTKVEKFILNGIIGFRFRQAIILHRTNEALVRYELLIPRTNQFVFVFVFVFVLAHEQANIISALIHENLDWHGNPSWFSCIQEGPTFKVEYLKSGLIHQKASFFLWKFGVLSFIWLWFLVNIWISLRMVGIWKKMF